VAKNPLITRSQLRKHREEATRQEQIAQRQYQEEEKRISNHYRREIKKNKPIKATRSSRNRRSRKFNDFLVKGIVIVALLLILVLVMVFYL